MIGFFRKMRSCTSMARKIIQEKKVLPEMSSVCVARDTKSSEKTFEKYFRMSTTVIMTCQYVCEHLFSQCSMPVLRQREGRAMKRLGNHSNRVNERTWEFRSRFL